MDVKSFEGVADWHARNPSGAFPMRSALDWFIKMHRPELVARGVLVPGRGRAGSIVHAEQFGQVALEILVRERAA